MEELDAREEVRSLVNELNSNAGRQFSFSKDVVLKTALTIAGVDVRFKVSNFTQANMAKVEDAWPQIKGALLRAAILLQQFGYNERNLTANSVIVPIAHYLHLRGAGDSYLDCTADAADRLALQRWVTRSLIKRGIWGQDSTPPSRESVRCCSPTRSGSFPVADVEAAMAAVGKGLDLHQRRDRRAPEPQVRRTAHLLSPLRSLPRPRPQQEVPRGSHLPQVPVHEEAVAAAGVPAESIDAYLDGFNLLPNLQLLAGTANIEKQDALPADWIAASFPSEEKRKTYVEENDLDEVSLDLQDFLHFYDERKARIQHRLIKTLGGSTGDDPAA